MKNTFEEGNKEYRKKNPALALMFNCCGRKPLLDKDVVKEHVSLQKKFSKLPIVGFHTFGEVGAKPNVPSQTCNQSLSMLILYDNLLTE
jgi:hypothetical protein